VNIRKLEMLRAADRTKLVDVTSATMFTPDGYVEGVVNITVNVWQDHAHLDKLITSLTFNEARKLARELEQALTKLDTDLHTQKQVSGQHG